MLVCQDQTGATVYERETVYNPGDPASMLQGEDGALARAISAALADLNAPPPQVRTSPPLDHRQIVGVKTWFWLESWDSILAPASAAGYTITLTATPDELIIDPGDGSGPMPPCTQANSPAWKPKDEGGPRDTGCGHTYHQRSGDKPGGVFKASATLNYRVTWRATDPAGTDFDSGDLGTITGVQPLDITVHQIQAVGRS